LGKLWAKSGEYGGLLVKHFELVPYHDKNLVS